MASQNVYLKKLNEKKVALIEFLDEYNKLCVKVANELANGCFAHLDLRIIQKKVRYFPNAMYGFYSAITVKSRSQKLKDIYHKKATIEGHEYALRSRGTSYDDLLTKISGFFGYDVREKITTSQEFSELVKKFDSYGFSPSELIPLAHLLFFEHVSLVPELYEGQHPSYHTALRSFLDNLSYSEFSFDEDTPHQVFKDLIYWMNRSDVDVDSL